MSKKIAWVTDSTASFSLEDADWLKENHVYVVPLYVIFDGISYKEGIDLSFDAFYKKMAIAEIPPTSSQPSIGDFIQLFETLKAQYDEVVLIHVSSSLSGTLSTSVQAANLLEIKTHAVDSWIGSFPLRFMIKSAVELYNKGEKLDQIITTLHNLRSKLNILLLPSSLSQLKKSGRVSNLSSIVGSLLKIKPLLALSEGKVNMIDKIRTYKKAKNTLLEHFSEAQSNGILPHIALLHTGNIDDLKDVYAYIKDKFSDFQIETLPLIPVAGVHLGVGTIGLSWVSK